MNGSPSVKVALFIRNGGSESPCRWFYVTGIYNLDNSHMILFVGCKIKSVGSANRIWYLAGFFA